MSEPVTIDPARKFGPGGNYWGNLLLPADEMKVGDPFRFPGDDVVYVVRRVLPHPMEHGKRVYHYERSNRYEATA